MDTFGGNHTGTFDEQSYDFEDPPVDFWGNLMNVFLDGGDFADLADDWVQKSKDDSFSMPWQNTYPFKPYSNVSDFVIGTSQTVSVPFICLSASAVALTLAAGVGVLSVGAILGSPVNGLAGFLLQAGSSTREDDDGLILSGLKATKNGVIGGAKAFGALFITGVVGAVVAAVVAAVALLFAAAAAVSLLLGVTWQASRCVSTVVVAPVKLAQAGLSMFSASAEADETSMEDDMDPLEYDSGTPVYQ